MATILCCDKCGKTPAKRFTICVEKCMDRAGSSDTRDIILDLCVECVLVWFKKLLAGIGMHGQRTRDIVEEFTGKIPEVV